MGKDTVVIRSEVGLSVVSPIIKYPEEVRKYYLQYGPCEVLHSVCKKRMNSTLYVVILQFKQSSHANQVKQKYNGRVLEDTRVTTCWFDAKQAKELGLPPPPPPHQTKKGPQWNRYADDSLSVSSQDSVRGLHTSQDLSESESSQVLGHLTPEMERPNTPGLRRTRASSPPARSLSKERHDSLERPDSQLSTYSHSSRERGQGERRERTSVRERSESLSSRYSVRFGSRSTAEEKEFSHHSEGGTRKRRASSPPTYSGSKRSKEDPTADERRMNIFDRLGPSSALKEKQHQLEHVSDFFSTSSGAKGSSSGVGHSRSSQSSDRHHASPGPSSDHEQRSYMMEYMPRRRGRELLTVKEEIGENSSEERERERRRKLRSESYREMEREERERGRERERVWEREKERERSRGRHRERKREGETDSRAAERKLGRGGNERQWRELQSEGDILWEHNIDATRERGEEDNEKGRRLNTGEGEMCVDIVVGDRHANTFGEVLDDVKFSVEEITEKKMMDREREEDERRRDEQRRARDKERARHHRGRERRDRGQRTTSISEVRGEVEVIDTETQPTSEMMRERSADDELSPATFAESRDYNDRDVTPPLEVLQSMQSSYQQTFFPSQFHSLPGSDLSYPMFRGPEHLQQLPQTDQDDSAHLPAASLGYQVQSGSGVIPTTSGWAVPAGISPAQWQLWLQSIEKQRDVVTGTGVLTTTVATSEMQASSEQLAGSLEDVLVSTTTESSAQAEATPPEVEAPPPQSRLSVSSLSMEQTVPQHKRKLDDKCKKDYKEMMKAFRSRAAALATATKLMIQENPDKESLLEDALESTLCRFAQTLLEKFQKQT